MKKAAADAKLNSSINKKLVNDQFHGRGSLRPQNLANDTMAGTKPFLGTIANGKMSQADGTFSSDGFDANNRTMGASSRGGSTLKQSA